jgi:hypothetical protein
MDEISSGSVIRLRNFDHYPPEGSIIRAGYTAPKECVFIAILVGVEKKDGSDNFDPEWGLNDIGWYSGSQIERHLGEEAAIKLGKGVDADHRKDRCKIEES